MTTIWIWTVAVLVVVPALAVVAAAWLLKPRLRSVPSVTEKIILIFGLPLTCGLSAGSLVMAVYDEPHTADNTVEIEIRVDEYRSRAGSWVNFSTPDHSLTFQVPSHLRQAFAYDAFVRELNSQRTYTLRADRDMVRLATRDVVTEAADFPRRLELLLFRLVNDRGLVWVYDVRSAGTTYLTLGDANYVRTRQKWLLLCLVAPIFLVAFAADAVVVAGFCCRPGSTRR